MTLMAAAQGAGGWVGRAPFIYSVIDDFVASRQRAAAEDRVAQARRTCFHGDGGPNGEASTSFP